VPGVRAVTLDVTSEESVDALAASLDRCDVLVNNAGGAFGLAPVVESKVEDWRWMFEVNVIGSLLMTRALLPKLIASGDGVLVMLTSTAGFVAYEGGGGYCAAKHAQTAMTKTLRLELFDQPVRVIEVAPGMVRTEEFALNRFEGDAERAAKVYEGVAEPLTADDVADVIAYAATRPRHVNLDRLVVRPRAQAAQHKVHRVPS
jgi:NADP-dependent 3-hydroxy acid dehydrogenase YdfG